MPQSSPPATNPEPGKYFAFISYRHADNEDEGRQWATWMHKALETYVIPPELVGTENKRKEKIPKRISRVFRDEEELAADANLEGSIIQALDSSQYLVVICSPRAVESPYVASEINYFKRTKSDRVLAMIIDGEPGGPREGAEHEAGWEECFPEPLRYKIHANGTVTTEPEEPIAADFRLTPTDAPPKQGWTSAKAYQKHLSTHADLTREDVKLRSAEYQEQLELMKLKIIAGILGIELGELTQRDKAHQLKLARKRARTMRRWLTAVGVLFVLAVAGGVFAMIQRATAIRERDESEARRLAAVSEANAVEQTDVGLLFALESLALTETAEGWRSLFKALSRPVLARSPLTGHRDFVNKVAFSSDGTLLASASDDRAIRIWDVRSGQPVGDPLKGHSGAVEALTFHPRRALLASADEDGSLMLWDLGERKLVWASIDLHDDVVCDLAFSSDGALVASASSDGAVQVCRVDTGDKFCDSLEGHEGAVCEVTFNADGSRVATASVDGTARVWDIPSGKHIIKVRADHRKWVHGLSFSPDGSTLAAACSDSAVRFWDLASGMETGKPLIGHGKDVWAVAFRPDGNRIATASDDQSVRLWDIESGEQLGDPLTGHALEVRGVQFSPDGSQLASASLDETVRLWDLSTTHQVGVPLMGHEKLQAVALNFDGSKAASASLDGSVVLWDVASRSPHGEPLAAHRGDVTSVTFSPTGTLLASTSSDKLAILWDVEKHEQLARIFHDDEISKLGKALLHDNAVFGAEFSPDGKVLATGSADGTVVLWNVQSQTEKARLPGHASEVQEFAFSPDGSLLAAPGTGGTVRLWNVGTGLSAGTLNAKSDAEIRELAFTKDGSHLATVDSERTVRMWEIESGRETDRTLSGHDRWVTEEFDQEGRHLMTASKNGTLQLWTTATGKPSGVPMSGHRGPVKALTMSRNGSMIASAGSDGTVRLWHARNHWKTLARRAASPYSASAKWRELLNPAPTSISP